MRSHLTIAGMVLAAHGAVIAWYIVTVDQVGYTAEAPQTTVAVLLSNPDPHSDRTPVTPLPEPHVQALPGDSTAIRQIAFVDPDADLQPGVIGAVSVPQAAALDPAEVSLYAERAGLQPGEAATVILAIEVQADGSAGSIEVLSSEGNPEVDAAAIALARLQHWTPGTFNRRTTAMRIQWTVTLVNAAPATVS